MNAWEKGQEMRQKIQAGSAQRQDAELSVGQSRWILRRPKGQKRIELRREVWAGHTNGNIHM